MRKRVNDAKKGELYLGQCVHVWQRGTDVERCANCPATCKRDERGRVVEFDAGIPADPSKPKAVARPTRDVKEVRHG